MDRTDRAWFVALLCVPFLFGVGVALAWWRSEAAAGYAALVLGPLAILVGVAAIGSLEARPSIRALLALGYFVLMGVLLCLIVLGLACVFGACP